MAQSALEAAAVSQLEGGAVISPEVALVLKAALLVALTIIAERFVNHNKASNSVPRHEKDR